MRLANLIIFIAFLLILSIGTYGDSGIPLQRIISIDGWDLYDYGSIVVLMLTCIAIMIVTTGIRFAAVMAALFVSIGFLWDKRYGSQHVFQLDDAFWILSGLLSGTSYMIIKKQKWIADREAILILAILTIKVLTTLAVYSTGKLICIELFGMQRSIYEIGIPFTYMMAAAYYARNTYQKTLIMPLLYLALTVNDFADELKWDPYNFNFEEVRFMGFAIVLILLYAINRKYRFFSL